MLAETATRRDLGDDRTISKYAAEVRTSARNALLYTLTIGDSRTTGPAAWNVSKAFLVRELFAKADTRLRTGRRGRRGPRSTPRVWARCLGETDSAARSSTPCPTETREQLAAEELAHHRGPAHGRYARDRVDRASTRVGGGARSSRPTAPDCSPPQRVRSRWSASTSTLPPPTSIPMGSRSRCSPAATGSTVSVLTKDASPRPRPSADTLAGAVALDEQLHDRAPPVPTGDRGGHGSRRPRARRHRRVGLGHRGRGVHAPDDVGLLARVAAVFVDLDLDVGQALVSTVGDRVVDVFYLHDTTGTRFAQRHAVESLRATLLSRLTAVVTLDGRLAGTE